VQAVGAAIGVILGAVYMLMVVQKMFFGPITKKANANLRDMNARELVAAAPLVMMIFVIGLFPNIFLSRIGAAAARVQDDFDARVMSNPAPTYYTGPVRLLPPRPESLRGKSELPAVAAKEAP
jgi:NADH-quinone oxidoreductase subunit M